ncbi:MAG TPA: hypothetical protein VH518_23050 [Tepidisphaeraceae bacterium]
MKFNPNELHTKRARLLARIQRRYQTVTETHAIGPLRLPFTRVTDPDVVLDQIVEQEDRRERLTGQRRDGNDLHLPYWAELWDSAFGIGAFLADHPVTPSPRHPLTVLDLGCGMGFAGMVAAAMGAHVLLADLESDALLFARLNTLPWWDQVRTRRLDWQKDRLYERFDVIVGADVLYDRSQWEFLETFFRAHLKIKGVVLLGEPGRQTGDMFPEWIASRGWDLEAIERKVATRQRPIRIFRVSTLTPTLSLPGRGSKSEKIKHS